MGAYTLRTIQLSDFGRHQMLSVVAACMPNAAAGVRQTALEHLAKLHNMNLRTTSSIRYDPSLTTRDGKNQSGNIRMGPSAFNQDYHWLAAVLFHEVVHSDQLRFYAQHGVSFSKPKYEAERIMVALDECEGFYWPWRNSRPLDLSPQQTASFKREVQLWMVEIDDEETVAFVRKGAFQQAREALVKRLEAEKKGPTASAA